MAAGTRAMSIRLVSSDWLTAHGLVKDVGTTGRRRVVEIGTVVRGNLRRDFWCHAGTATRDAATYSPENNSDTDEFLFNFMINENIAV